MEYGILAIHGLNIVSTINLSTIKFKKLGKIMPKWKWTDVKEV